MGLGTERKESWAPDDPSSLLGVSTGARSVRRLLCHRLMFIRSHIRYFSQDFPNRYGMYVPNLSNLHDVRHCVTCTYIHTCEKHDTSAAAKGVVRPGRRFRVP